MYNKKNLFKKLFLFTLIVIFSTSFMFGGVAKAYRKISNSDLRDLIASRSPMILIDVRNTENYNSGRIPTSVNIPLEKLENEIKEKNITKPTQIIVYSETEEDSLKATHLLEDLGYTCVYNFGSIKNWSYKLIK